MLLELIEQHRDCLFKLRIMAVAHRLGIEFYFDVRRDAGVFHFPRAARGPESAARRRENAAIHQLLLWTKKPYEPAPCPLADHWADLQFTEVERQGIAPGTCVVTS